MALMPPTLETKALKILFSAYWSSSGWKTEPEISAADFSFAKTVGVMFDPAIVTHDQAVDWAERSIKRVSLDCIVQAFMASLSSRRLDLRSALGSFATLRHFPPHTWPDIFSKMRLQPVCPICGALEGAQEKQDLSRLNFERFRWGGVNHLDPIYAAFDLERFAEIEAPLATSTDAAILRQILETAETMPKDAKLSDLSKALAPVFPSNNSERRIVIEILGYCGVLRNPSKPGFLDGYPRYCDREDPPWPKNDWAYPVLWWNGSHGICSKAIAHWFPGLSHFFPADRLPN